MQSYMKIGRLIGRASIVGGAGIGDALPPERDSLRVDQKIIEFA